MPRYRTVYGIESMCKPETTGAPYVRVGFSPIRLIPEEWLFYCPRRGNEFTVRIYSQSICEPAHRKTSALRLVSPVMSLIALTQSDPDIGERAVLRVCLHRKPFAAVFRHR